jgi:hypothetical protein
MHYGESAWWRRCHTTSQPAEHDHRQQPAPMYTQFAAPVCLIFTVTHPLWQHWLLTRVQCQHCHHGPHACMWRTTASGWQARQTRHYRPTYFIYLRAIAAAAAAAATRLAATQVPSCQPRGCCFAFMAIITWQLKSGYGCDAGYWVAVVGSCMHVGVQHLFIVTSAQLRSRCDVWLALKASLQTVHHVLHAASEIGS